MNIGDQTEKALSTTQYYIDYAIKLAIDYAPTALTAITALFVGFWVIKKINKAVLISLDKAGISKDISPFLASLINFGLKVMLFFFVAGIVGIETASFVAMLAAAGFAVGLALQGSLGNFAAGIVILFFKPYKVGDLVDIQGKFGEVREIQIFNTILMTPGGKNLIIPNGSIINGIVTNFSANGALRLELNIKVPFTENYQKVESTIRYALRQVNEVLPEPVPEVGIESFDTHGVNIAIRPIVKPTDYWQARFEVFRQLKIALSEAEISLVTIEDATGTKLEE